MAHLYGTPLYGTHLYGTHLYSARVYGTCVYLYYTSMACSHVCPQSKTVVGKDGHQLTTVKSVKRSTNKNGHDTLEMRVEEHGDNLVPRRESTVIPAGFHVGLNYDFEKIVVDSVIGKGSFGQVFKAHVEGVQCAVKQLFLEGDQDSRDEIQADFAKECTILEMLHHPNIVKFFGAVQTPPTLCMITELCEGSVVDLLTMVGREHINVTWGLLWKIAKGSAEALRYLHFECQPQIIHRDVKAEVRWPHIVRAAAPFVHTAALFVHTCVWLTICVRSTHTSRVQNLLLDSHFVCKLTDFGLSRIIDINHTHQNKHMTLCGTPSWVAPEIFRGEAYNHKIDVYSFGIVMWELVCFRKPYLDEDPVKLPYKVSLHGLRPPLAPHIPQLFAEMMTKCWEGEASDRPDFTEVCQLMEDFDTRSHISFDEPVDVTKVGNDLYKLAMKVVPVKKVDEVGIPGAVEGEEKGEGDKTAEVSGSEGSGNVGGS